jgi:hypothetical protein
MDPAPFSGRAPQRALLLRTATVVVLSAVASAHATNDGLYITGLTQWAAIAARPYTFTPKVANPSGRALTFGIVNKPSWATLNTRTGQLWGTPPDIIKTYYNISISVTDGVTTAKTPYFYIRVYPPNTSGRPSISGTATTSVTAGRPYTFQPSARDAYGQPLSFSVKNKPAWASFSIATGRLYGTPTSAQAGTYGNIEISVTNGELAAALPAFSVTVKNGVTSTSTGSASLSWVLPTENTNGTALTDLAGVLIYYGTSASNLSHVMQVSSPGETGYTIGDLAAGVWYFATTAYTTAGTESELSSVVSKSIP